MSGVHHYHNDDLSVLYSKNRAYVLDMLGSWWNSCNTSISWALLKVTVSKEEESPHKRCQVVSGTCESEEKVSTCIPVQGLCPSEPALEDQFYHSVAIRLGSVFRDQDLSLLNLSQVSTLTKTTPTRGQTLALLDVNIGFSWVCLTANSTIVTTMACLVTEATLCWKDENNWWRKAKIPCSWDSLVSVYSSYDGPHICRPNPPRVAAPELGCLFLRQ